MKSFFPWQKYIRSLPLPAKTCPLLEENISVIFRYCKEQGLNLGPTKSFNGEKIKSPTSHWLDWSRINIVFSSSIQGNCDLYYLLSRISKLHRRQKYIYVYISIPQIDVSILGNQADGFESKQFTQFIPYRHYALYTIFLLQKNCNKRRFQNAQRLTACQSTNKATVIPNRDAERCSPCLLRNARIHLQLPSNCCISLLNVIFPNFISEHFS